MSEIDRTRCPHCHAELEATVAGTDFWVRCGGCGRRVMPRSWSRIVSDSEPSALFRPAAIERRNSANLVRGERYPVSSRSAGSRMTRNQIIALTIPTIVASSASCLLFSDWYTTADLLICGFMGMLLTIFIVFVPKLLISVGTGAITLAFLSALFGFSGNEFFQGAYYFLFGFSLASIIQAVSGAMAKEPQVDRYAAEPAAAQADADGSVAAAAHGSF